MVLNGLISAFCRWPGSFVIKDWTSNERLGEILASEASINVYMVDILQFCPELYLWPYAATH